MFNIIELEKKWIKYKIKYYLPHFTILVSTLIITSALFIFIKHNNNHECHDTTATQPIKKVITPNVLKQIPPTLNKQIPSTERQLRLQPSLSFLNNMQTPKIKHHKVLKTKKSLKVKTAKVIRASTPKNVSKINIKRKETKQDLQTIIKRFKKNNNPHLSLFIAKRYYAQKNYKKAYNYALITNKIDSSIDESWIIFCKALVKLNKREFAIKILQDYANNSKSSTVNILLSDIKSGKFK